MALRAIIFTIQNIYANSKPAREEGGKCNHMVY